ncbi:MAG: hypothetical protein RBS37_02450 [Bacteroidales bacterium]|jgi:hypothetical protein|nr:hypothetical protein [Bacteroidales bacterium]
MNSYKDHVLYRKHTLDSAMESLWTFYKTNFAPLFIISFLFTTIVTFLSINIDTEKMIEAASSQDMEAWKTVMREIALSSVPAMLVSLLSLSYISLYILNGSHGSYDYVKMFGRSFVYFLTFTIIMILFVPVAAIAVVAGILALIIGVIFSAIWLTALAAFFMPLLMAEGNNITNAIARSFKLMHRHFGSNLGWTAVVLVIILIISLVISGLSLIPFAGSFLKTMSNPEEAAHLIDMAKNPIYIIFSSALNALVMPVLPIFGFILYFNAKAWEDDSLNNDVIT